MIYILHHKLYILASFTNDGLVVICYFTSMDVSYNCVNFDSVVLHITSKVFTHETASAEWDSSRMYRNLACPTFARVTVVYVPGEKNGVPRRYTIYLFPHMKYTITNHVFV